ncbi:MAG: hypothetical protein CMC95_02835 [Flavobacteriales bacterium]|nr:hypothetical protein [Flavobacteriales bacterium]|tara:strand:- start:449 stop:1483 length:1035 start_codon:yes stop_codon:yes gene_type:complete
MKKLILISFFLISISYCKGQGCPACSNPALQSNEKLESDLVQLNKGDFRLTMNIINGNDYQGGHFNSLGLNEVGEVISTPLHKHQINLDFIRTEVSLEYTLQTNWTTWLRVPYDLKMQTATIDFIELATQEEKEAIVRNKDIHHRTENYSGLSDLRLLISHRINSVFTNKDKIDIALGSSLPIGEIEDNPIKAGNEGRKHLHIQFGSGTFDPLLEFHYALSLSDKVSLALFSINKLTFYENKLNYKGSNETTTGLSLGYFLTKSISPRITYVHFSQSQAQWDGENDPNSGLISNNLTANVSVKLNNGISITPGFRLPLNQKTIDSSGDVFEYGYTYTLNVSKKL